MNTEEQARELTTKERQHEEHLQASMLHRAESEANRPQPADAVTTEQARELTAKERQHEEHLQASMLHRAESKGKS